VDFASLEPRRHDPPSGWTRETFEGVTDALAAALVAAIEREREQGRAR
jgi:hypothetical protein